MKTKTHTSKKLLNYLSVFKGVKLPWILMAFSLCFSLLMMRSELQVATLTADIIDSTQRAINSKVLLEYVAMAAAVAAFSIANSYFGRKVEEVINCRVRVKLWRKIMRLPSQYYDEDNGNQLVSRITSDASAPSLLFSLAISCITCIVISVQAFSQLFTYHKTLAMYSLLIIPLTLLFCALYAVLQFKLGVYSTATFAGSLGYLAERVRNFRLIKSAVTEKLESQKGSKTFKQMYKADFLTWLMIAGYQMSSGLFSILFIVVVFVIGGQLVPKGEITIGELTGFYSITGIVSLQLMQFFMNIGSLYSTLGNMRKITEISETPVERQDGAAVPSGNADIVFNDVTFAYNDERNVLNALSLRIPHGKVTAIIGGNGAGKSTLFKLLERLYEPKSGTICFGNEDIAQYNLTQWRDRFAYVFQKTPLVSGTVRENLLYGLDRPVSDEELIAITKKANCYDCIMEKPNGFDEVIGIDGSGFSGGQAQCISIARAMLRNADYLLLDEATCNLDVVSEAAVTQALDSLMQGKTTIMIAHNYAATRNADYVIVMNGGTVETAGTPDELLQSSSYYQAFSNALC